MKCSVLNRVAFTLVAIAMLTLACTNAPFTGRRQLILIPASQMMAMSYQQYSDFINTNPISKDRAATAMVKRVGNRIRQATERYYAQQNMSADLKGYEWEFNLVESPEPNAWCMPGGKVVFYSGILEFTQDEAGLAVVMGHEIAHAIARHGGERMSHGLLTQMGGIALSEALSSKPEETRSLWLGAYGLGTQVGVLLPYSRTHEKEADHLGLILMAKAGYHPKAAAEFWKRMGAAGGNRPPEFLSTHPAPCTRIREIEALIPEAMQYYENRGN
jgi:predicted Zn-dependent protease